MFIPAFVTLCTLVAAEVCKYIDSKSMLKVGLSTNQAAPID